MGRHEYGITWPRSTQIESSSRDKLGYRATRKCSESDTTAGVDRGRSATEVPLGYYADNRVG